MHPHRRPAQSSASTKKLAEVENHRQSGQPLPKAQPGLFIECLQGERADAGDLTITAAFHPSNELAEIGQFG
jgi:hypothetical protein